MGTPLYMRSVVDRKRRFAVHDCTPAFLKRDWIKQKLELVGRTGREFNHRHPEYQSLSSRLTAQCNCSQSDGWTDGYDIYKQTEWPLWHQRRFCVRLSATISI